MIIKKFEIRIRNTKLLYTMTIKVLRDYSIFILAIMIFLSSCQLTTTGEKKSVLDEGLSTEEKAQSLEKDIAIEERKEDFVEKSDRDFVLTETEPTVDPAPLKETYENMSSAQKIKDKKRILDFFSDLFKSNEEEEKKSETVNKKNTDFTKKQVIASNDKKVDKNLRKEQTEIFKQEKPKDEKRILDFFTKFFDSEDQKLQGETIKKQSMAKQAEISGEKLNNSKEEDKFNETLEQGNLTLDKLKDDKYKKANDFKKKVVITEPDVTSSLKEIKIEEIVDNDKQTQDKTKSISIQDPLNKNIEKKMNESNAPPEKDNVDKINDLAFLDTRKSAYKKKMRTNNLVGLLLPLTGEKRSAGNLVLNTFRYSLVSNPKDIVFKIYDTRGTSYGAVEAAKKGKKDNVDTFIGPVFSDETLAIKNAFAGDSKVKFFSLSPDLENISRNVIVSGQNPKDQISCILDDIESKELKKILLIHHNDKYGEVIKKSLEERIYKLNKFNKLELSFFTVFPEQNLNKDIMAISNFESRKLALKEKRKFIENDKSLTKFERKNELKKLERQLTFGVPFDSIIIASDGDKLTEILSHLAFYDINANNTFIYGTSLWEDTNKKDKVFENTYFVSNLKSKESSFVKNYKDVFSRDPSSVSFHLFDLIDLVNDSKFYDIYPEDKVFFGEYTNSLLKSGYVKRETFIKKNKSGKTKNVFSCRLNEI